MCFNCCNLSLSACVCASPCKSKIITRFQGFYSTSPGIYAQPESTKYEKSVGVACPGFNRVCILFFGSPSVLRNKTGETKTTVLQCPSVWQKRSTELS